MVSEKRRNLLLEKNVEMNSFNIRQKISDCYEPKKQRGKKPNKITIMLNANANMCKTIGNSIHAQALQWMGVCVGMGCIVWDCQTKYIFVMKIQYIYNIYYEYIMHMLYTNGAFHSIEMNCNEFLFVSVNYVSECLPWFCTFFYSPPWYRMTLSKSNEQFLAGKMLSLWEKRFGR